MKVLEIEIFRIEVPLKKAWVTGSGEFKSRESVLVLAHTDVGDGWGECAALPKPGYTTEFAAGAYTLLKDQMGPLLIGETIEMERRNESSPAFPVIDQVGPPMASAALEMALLDAHLRSEGVSLAHHLGGTRETIPAGISLGYSKTPQALAEEVAAAYEQGFQRVKVKVAPDRDVTFLTAVRNKFPYLELFGDANGSYDDVGAKGLAELERFDLAMIEQPLTSGLDAHARLAEEINIPICLDEGIKNAAGAASAIEAGACAVINLKAPRVGSFAEALRIHDLSMDAGIDLWVGGMVDCGLGRAANIALGSLPGFTRTGDISPNSRFFKTDITVESFEIEGGAIAVPTGPGLGVTIDEDALTRFTQAHAHL